MSERWTKIKWDRVKGCAAWVLLKKGGVQQETRAQNRNIHCNIDSMIRSEVNLESHKRGKINLINFRPNPFKISCGSASTPEGWSMLHERENAIPLKRKQLRWCEIYKAPRNQTLRSLFNETNNVIIPNTKSIKNRARIKVSFQKCYNYVEGYVS